jgi:hypothetical protein
MSSNYCEEPRSNLPTHQRWEWPGMQGDYLRAERSARRVRRDFDYSLTSIDARSSFVIESVRNHEERWFRVQWSLNQTSLRAVTFANDYDEELIAFALIDELWEDIVEYISAVRSGMAVLWPQCPRHPHALTLAFEDGKAEWRCREDPLVFSPVGSLEYLR